MSSNIINTIGQQVFRYDPPEFTETGVPFPALNSTSKEKEEGKNGVEEPKYQFLGEGYYFWDDNLWRAHNWGRTHCSNK